MELLPRHFLPRSLGKSSYASPSFNLVLTHYRNSSIAFVIIPLSGSAANSFQRMQFLVVSGCLFVSFINMGLVIRNYKHVTWITCTPADQVDIEAQDHAHNKNKMTEKRIRDLSVFLLKRAALHWNIGKLHKELWTIINKCFFRHTILLHSHCSCSVGLRCDGGNHRYSCAHCIYVLDRSSYMITSWTW